MDIRITGTVEECNAAADYYAALEKQDNVRYVTVSRLYPNRGSNKLFRLYIQVEYYAERDAAATLGKGNAIAKYPPKAGKYIER